MVGRKETAYRQAETLASDRFLTDAEGIAVVWLSPDVHRVVPRGRVAGESVWNT